MAGSRWSDKQAEPPSPGRLGLACQRVALVIWWLATVRVALVAVLPYHWAVYITVPLGCDMIAPCSVWVRAPAFIALGLLVVACELGSARLRPAWRKASASPDADRLFGVHVGELRVVSRLRRWWGSAPGLRAGCAMWGPVGVGLFIGLMALGNVPGPCGLGLMKFYADACEFWLLATAGRVFTASVARGGPAWALWALGAGALGWLYWLVTLGFTLSVMATRR